jgi:hypothetical protein
LYHDLFGTTLAANSSVQLTPTAGGPLQWFGQWSTDSSRIVYVGSHTVASVFELYMATADGVSNTNISGTMVAGGNVSLTSVRWLP